MMIKAQQLILKKGIINGSIKWEISQYIARIEMCNQELKILDKCNFVYKLLPPIFNF